ncbi:MAG TPA: DUF523 domain-containing protein [Nitrospirae bacterium]|nr:hypothetical protein BMS3Abin10_00999 [bacterium BMS3Abin10]GBE38640.1 hypothetical protein BMS3Bbin08_01247 [bacterium BMS3Bbin08]HDH51742.1 DUF523 domain-containing protein [Nitrospirota bacterium]HDK16332.1 DUF523 domain-containing protein [Nitrospirota bacterium]HDK81138.1 DUF523 domain-containing protein [Nitrospirota bacterium]
MFLVSACLAGINSRYDGKDNRIKHFQDLVAMGKALPVCPEQLGGLSTPREPIELVGGDGEDILNGRAKAIGRSGADYTKELLRGAEEVLKIAALVRAGTVFFKDDSPSCGCVHIKAGGRRIRGRGVTAAVLIKNGIKVEAVNNLQSTIDNSRI